MRIISSVSCSLTVFVIVIITISVVGQTTRQRPIPATSKNVAARMIEARQIIAEANTSALRIKSEFQRGLVLDGIGAAQAKAGLLNEAVATARAADPHTMATLTAIGEQTAETNDLVKAKALGARLNPGSASTLLAVFAGRQAENGKLDEALRTTKYIEAKEVRRGALEGIAERQSANFDFAAARKTLALAKAADPTGRQQPDDPDDPGVMMALGQLSRGEVQSAQKTIDSFSSPDAKVDVLVSGAEVLLQHGEKQTASAWLERALTILPSGPRFEFSRYLAIPIQVKLDQSGAAMKAVASFSPEMRTKGYLTIAVVCAEVRDISCMNDALGKMDLAERSRQEGETFSDFRIKLMTLNVTAALIDNSQLEEASVLLTRLEQHLDDEVTDKRAVKPGAQLQRVFILVRQDQFGKALQLALKMEANSVADVPRGTALRTIAVFETKKNGMASSQQWASALTDSEDRAYAFLGIAEGLLKYNDPKVHYGVIQVH